MKKNIEINALKFVNGNLNFVRRPIFLRIAIFSTEFQLKFELNIFIKQLLKLLIIRII
jgi:hypothetical protein